MTELATLPQADSLAVPSAGAPALNLTATTVSLLEWAQELDAAHRLGTALCGTEFVPASFRGKPDAAAAAILAGKSLGLDPMNSLSNIFVVQGRPAMYARTMVALVLSAGHDVRRTTASPEAVTVMGRRKGQQEWQEFTWTIDRARQAGYLSNKKYNTDPIAMLTAKAQAEACRTIAPDVLTGVAAYSVEDVELEDMGETINSSAPPAPVVEKPKRTVKRRQAPAPAVPDVVAEPPTPEEEPQPESGPEDDVVDQETGELPPERDWLAEIDLANGDVTALRSLWKAAAAAEAAPETLDAIASAATAAKEA
ncbi:hypothetical protein ACFVRV_06305 [Arthrobacter koreensis]|uniref:hypothetical protein n=1 Tax=Arthrobacter koreensis TaxID=199136 RepID=UPI0036D8603C